MVILEAVLLAIGFFFWNEDLQHKIQHPLTTNIPSGVKDYQGGSENSNGYSSGGGGGSGGQALVSIHGYGGIGGSGTINKISGSKVGYAAGGGGGTNNGIDAG